MTEQWKKATGMEELPTIDSNAYGFTTDASGKFQLKIGSESRTTTKNLIPQALYPGTSKNPKIVINAKNNEYLLIKEKLMREIKYNLLYLINQSEILKRNVNEVENLVINLQTEIEESDVKIPKFGGNDSLQEDSIKNEIENTEIDGIIRITDEIDDELDDIGNINKETQNRLNDIQDEISKKMMSVKAKKLQGDKKLRNLNIQRGVFIDLNNRILENERQINDTKMDAELLQDSILKLTKLNVMFGDLPPPGSPVFADDFYERFGKDKKYNQGKIPGNSEYLSGCSRKAEDKIIKRESKPFQNLIAKMLGPEFAFNQIYSAGVGAGKTFGALMGIYEHLRQLYNGMETANTVDHILIGVPTVFHCFNPWLDELEALVTRPLDEGFKFSLDLTRKPFSYDDKSRHMTFMLRLYKGSSPFEDPSTVEFLITMVPFQQLRDLDVEWLSNVQKTSAGAYKLGKRQFLLIIDESHYVTSLWINNDNTNLCASNSDIIYDMTERASTEAFQKFVIKMMNSKKQTARLLMLSATPFADTDSMAFALNLLRPRFCGENSNSVCDQVSGAYLETFFVQNNGDWKFNVKKTIPWLNLMAGYLSYYTLNMDWRFYPRYHADQGYNSNKYALYYVYDDKSKRFLKFRRTLSESEYKAVLINDFFETPYITVWVPHSMFTNKMINRPKNMGDPKEHYHNLRFPNDLSVSEIPCNNGVYKDKTSPMERWNIEEERDPKVMANLMYMFMQTINSTIGRWIIYHGNPNYLFKVALAWGEISGYLEIGISNGKKSSGDKTFQIITSDSTVRVNKDSREKLTKSFISKSPIIFTDLLAGVDFNDLQYALSLQHMHPVLKKQWNGRQLRNCSLETGERVARSYLISDLFPNITIDKVFQNSDGSSKINIKVPIESALNTLDFSQNHYFSKFKTIQQEMINTSFDCKLNRDYHNSTSSEINNWTDMSSTKVKCLSFNTQDPACVPKNRVINPDDFGQEAFQSCKTGYKSPKGLTYSVKQAKRHDELNKKTNLSDVEMYEKNMLDAISSQLSESQKGYTQSIASSMNDISSLVEKYDRVNLR
jgi:hypothetical protein